MKIYQNKSLLIALSSLILLAACKKEGTNVVFKGGTAPVLTASVSDSIPLNSAIANNQAIAFSWTNPNYNFSNGISSLNVTYNLEFDTVGANFSSPNMRTVQISPNLSTSFTVAQLNSLIANGLQLAFGQSHNIQVRVVSLIAPYTSGSPNAGSLISNVLNYTVTPFAPPPVVDPPSSGTLYITGSATALGWMVGGTPSSVAGQQLTQVTPLLYKITLPLIGGQQFLVVPVAGDWSNKYATANAASLPTGGTFAYNASNNFNGPAASGTYTVTFNFQTGIYTITQ